jgi:hypothetical protein
MPPNARRDDEYESFEISGEEKPLATTSIHFEPRYEHKLFRQQPSAEDLRQYILTQGAVFGEATISRSGDADYLIVLYGDGLGYYIKYVTGDIVSLSLGDRETLSDVVCPDDWNASAGLFVPPEVAWMAISDFCETGERSERINWITSSGIPPEGDW